MPRKKKRIFVVNPQAVELFLERAIGWYKFHNKNELPDEIVIPEEANNLVEVKVRWPNNAATN